MFYGKSDWSAQASYPVPGSFFDGIHGFFLQGSCTAGNTYNIASTNTTSGAAIAVADLNKDGHTDIVIGTGNNSSTGVSQAGSILILFGPASGWPASVTLNAAYMDGVHGVEIDGVRSGDQTGVVLATADINNDSYTDLIIGSPGYMPNALNHAGSVWGIWGRSATAWSNYPLTNLSTVH